MKRTIKITIASILLLSLLCPSVGAYRVKKSRDDYFYPKTEVATIEKGMYYEDFTGSVVGEKPSGSGTADGQR